MKRNHAAYEALAGAVLLGEATEEERAAYDAHAGSCAQCEPRPDATRTLVQSAFAMARHGETWRPFVRDEIMTRIEGGRTATGQRITLVLGAAVVATLALNVALALGTRPSTVALPRVATPPVTASSARVHVRFKKDVGRSVVAVARPAARRGQSDGGVRSQAAPPEMNIDAGMMPAGPAPAGVLPASLVSLPLESDSTRSRR